MDVFGLSSQSTLKRYSLVEQRRLKPERRVWSRWQGSRLTPGARPEPRSSEQLGRYVLIFGIQSSESSSILPLPTHFPLINDTPLFDSVQLMEKRQAEKGGRDWDIQSVPSSSLL